MEQGNYTEQELRDGLKLEKLFRLPGWKIFVELAKIYIDNKKEAVFNNTQGQLEGELNLTRGNGLGVQDFLTEVKTLTQLALTWESEQDEQANSADEEK